MITNGKNPRGCVYQKAMEMVDRVQSQEALGLFLRTVTQNLTAADLQYAAGVLLAQAVKAGRKEGEEAALETLTEEK
jgi:ATP:corrinoid adenosyltransferase